MSIPRPYSSDQRDASARQTRARILDAAEHELIRHGYDIQRLERERASEEEINRHLRLEIETLRSPNRIEDMAIKELKLVAPDRDKAIVIERVTPTEPPDKSIVALREAQGEPEPRRRAPAR